MRILLIDDDEQLVEALARKLIKQHYAVDIASNSEMGWEFILLFNFDLIVLDWMLPDVDGISLCQKIRRAGYKMPIMLLTARNLYIDKVIALDSGADDYVVKPFNFDELTARIRALLRRDISVSSPVLQWHNLSLDSKTHEVRYGDRLLLLTPKEYSLIELFMRHPQQVFSPSAIIDNLWTGKDPPGEESVRTHIKSLRQKIKAIGMAKDTIETVYGVGYRLKPDREKHNNTDKSDVFESQEPDRTYRIAQVWSSFQNLAFQRLNVLESLVAKLMEGKVTSDLHHQAKMSAHKLAGSLGCFGFSEGSKIAKQIEILLEQDFISRQNIQSIAELTFSLCLELEPQPFRDKVKDTIGKSISLLIIESNADFRDRLVTEAEKSGMRTHTASSLNQAQAIIDRESIDAILHNIVPPNDRNLESIQQLHQHKPILPIITIAEPSQLRDCLDIIRSGGNLILQHPVDAHTAIVAVTESIQNSGTAVKVLIIDDDPQVLLSLKMCLKPWGFDLTTVDTPQKFWKVLEKVVPNILILDIKMPEINGIEICQLLKSDRRWQQLPILFLSVDRDETTKDMAFNIGADDYICKPVTGSILANRILGLL